MLNASLLTRNFERSASVRTPVATTASAFKLSLSRQKLVPSDKAPVTMIPLAAYTSLSAPSLMFLEMSILPEIAISVTQYTPPAPNVPVAVFEVIALLQMLILAVPSAAALALEYTPPPYWAVLPLMVPLAIVTSPWESTRTPPPYLEAVLPEIVPSVILNVPAV